MESPVVIENCVDFKLPVNNNTGFPFDDTDYDTNDHLQSTLNDLAQRHPEFATHLNFPTWRRKRHGSGSSADKDDTIPPTSGQNSRSFDTPDSRRFADHSFPSGFNRFPFTHHFDDFTDDIRTEEKPPEVPRPHEKRGRKVNPNLPQHLSNTVDLGQKQAPAEETRGQRSMSAPPENRSTHNTSKFDNDPSRDMGNMFQRPGRAQQTRVPSTEQPTPKPKERVIPIFVEGRDEPIIPKNVNIEPEKVFNDDANNIYHQNFHPQQTSAPKQQTSAPCQQQNAPSNFTRPPTPPTQRKPPNKPAAAAEPEEQGHPQNVQQEQYPSVNMNDPLEKIKLVKSDVLNLMQQVEDFTGTRKDKHYIYLDEMLTRNLLKLDNVETEGKDNIRTARREAIKCIQECINKLDANAQAFEKLSSNVTGAVGLPAQSSAKPEETEQHPVIETKKPVFKSEAKIVIKVPEIISDVPSENEIAPPMDIIIGSSADLNENADKQTTMIPASTESMEVDSQADVSGKLTLDSSLVAPVEKTTEESTDGTSSETKPTDMLPSSTITNSSQLANETNM